MRYTITLTTKEKDSADADIRTWSYKQKIEAFDKIAELQQVPKVPETERYISSNFININNLI